MFDCDEDFLFENKAYKGLLKKITTHYDHLVNPNFDLSDLRDEKNKYFEKHLKSRTSDTPELSSVRNDYNETIISPIQNVLAGQAYDGMMQIYEDFFKEEK